MKKYLTLSAILFVLFACSAFAESSTLQLLNTMIEYGAPIDPNSFVDYTAATDPNGLMGEEGAYIEKTDFTMAKLDGTIEKFENSFDAYARFGYLKGVYSIVPSTVQNMFLRNEYVIRFDAYNETSDLSAALAAFELAIPNADTSDAYTVEPIVDDESLLALLESAGMIVTTGPNTDGLNSLTWISDRGINSWYLTYGPTLYEAYSTDEPFAVLDLFETLLSEYDFTFILFSDNSFDSIADVSYMPVGWSNVISNTNYTDPADMIEYVRGIILPVTSTARPATKDQTAVHVRKIVNENIATYTGTTLDRININPDYSTQADDDRIALIYMTWNIKNSKSTTEKMLTAYANDLAAKLAKQIPTLTEIAIFWDVPYLGLDAKNSYECIDGNAYIADVMY